MPTVQVYLNADEYRAVEKQAAPGETPTDVLKRYAQTLARIRVDKKERR